MKIVWYVAHNNDTYIDDEKETEKNWRGRASKIIKQT